MTILELFAEAAGEYAAGDGRMARIVLMVALCVWGVIALFNGSTIAAIVAFAMSIAVLLLDLKLRSTARRRMQV